MKEVWKCDLNYHKILWTFAWISPRIINGLRSYIKHSIECFLIFPKTSKLVEIKRGAAEFFQPTSRCLEIGGNTLPRVWSTGGKGPKCQQENTDTDLTLLPKGFTHAQLKWRFFYEEKLHFASCVAWESASGGLTLLETVKKVHKFFRNIASSFKKVYH